MSHNMEKIKLTEKQYIEECRSYLQQSVEVSRLSVTTGNLSLSYWWRRYALVKQWIDRVLSQTLWAIRTTKARNIIYLFNKNKLKPVWLIQDVNIINMNVRRKLRKYGASETPEKLSNGY